MGREEGRGRRGERKRRRRSRMETKGGK